jgi:hypothetical protein
MTIAIIIFRTIMIMKIKYKSVRLRPPRSSYGELPPNLPLNVTALIQNQQEALNHFNHHSTSSSSSKAVAHGEHVHKSKQGDCGDACYDSFQQQQYLQQQQQQQLYEAQQDPKYDTQTAQQQLRKTKERQSQAERLANAARRQQRALEKGQAEEQRRMRQTYGKRDARPVAQEQRRDTSSPFVLSNSTNTTVSSIVKGPGLQGKTLFENVMRLRCKSGNPYFQN